MNPRFSVIVPVCHGGDLLRDALASLGRLTPPAGGVEVLVTGQEDRVRFLEQRMKDAGQRFVRCGGNRAEALNAACGEARGSWWVFSDDDCVFPSDWMLNIEQAIERFPGAAVLGGSDLLAQGAGDFDLALDVVLSSWMGTGGTRADRTLKAGRYYPKLWNMVVSAEEAKRAATGTGRVFDPALEVHEDVELVERIEAQRGRVVHVPRVRVEHHRDTDFRSFFVRNMAMAAVCRHTGIHRAPHLALVAAVVGIFTLFLASIWASALRAVAFRAGGLYAAAAVLTGISGAWRKKRPALAVMIPGLLFFLHLARAVGYVSAGRSGMRALP